MHQDIIQSFLDQPEVVGIALMQGRIIPYFYVKENFVSPEKRIELIRHFRNNILETPALSDSLEFQINSYHAYTYKINNNLTLLIISFQDSVIVKSMINRILKSALENDLGVTIKSFENLTKKIVQPIKKEPEFQPSQKEIQTSTINSNESQAENHSIEEVVEMLNDLSQTVCCYLGPKITSNFWQLTRPKHEWLSQFNIKSNANIEFIGLKQNFVSPLQHLIIREWTNKFMNQCSQIVRDLPTMIDQQLQNKKHRNMISILPSGYLNELEYLSHKDNSLFE